MLDWITRRVWPVLRSTWDGWWEHDGNLLSAATAYYAALSLFPLCLVLIAGLGFVGRYSPFLQGQQRDLVELVSKNVNPWLGGQIDKVLAGVQAHALLGGPLGLLFLVLAAIGIFMQLENIFNRIWGAPAVTARSWQAALRLALWDRLLAFLMLLAIGAVLVTLFLADVIVAGVRPLVVHLPAGRIAWRVVQSLLSIGGNALLLGTIYKVLPKARVGWKQAFAGGLLAAVVWAVGQYVLLSMFVGEQYSAYGVIGMMIAVMFWFYYASAAVFLGAEFVRAASEDGSAQVQKGETKA